ncbi:MAG: NINE protein [Allosphingosinicella sp.]
MTVRTFGRKGSQEAAMASRVEAFMAAERARKIVPDAPNGRGSPPATEGFAPEKSLALAYVFWFGCGAVSAHRFYLGFPISGVAQASLWFVSWMMVVGGFLPAALGAVAAGLWILADAFLIPGLLRQANERSRRHAVIGVFA